MVNKSLSKEIIKLKFGPEIGCPNCDNPSKNSKVLYCKRYKRKIIDKKIICKNCGFIYKSPRMTLESNDFFYNELYIKYMFGDKKVNPYEIHYDMGKGRKHELKLFYKEIANTKYPPLEIGCSSGGVLSELRKINDSSEGIDIDGQAIEFAKNKGLNVRDTDLFNLPNKSRDFILMSHTIEHLGDLSKVLEKISKILVNGGYLLIFAPDSYEMLEPPHLPHDYCFSRDTLKSVLSKYNLKEINFIDPLDRPKGFRKDLIVLFRKELKLDKYKSNYHESPFLKYKYYLKLYFIVNPLLMVTNTKSIFRRILRKWTF